MHACVYIRLQWETLCMVRFDTWALMLLLSLLSVMWLSLNTAMAHFLWINTVNSPPLFHLCSPSINYFHAASHLPALPTPPCSSPLQPLLRRQAFQQRERNPRLEWRLMARTGSSPRALARDQEEWSWAGRAQISPPQSGTGAPLFPGLQLEERRLEQEGGADLGHKRFQKRF